MMLRIECSDRFVHRLTDTLKSKNIEQKHAKDAKGEISAEPTPPEERLRRPGGGAEGMLGLKHIPAGAATPACLAMRSIACRSPLPPWRTSRSSVQILQISSVRSAIKLLQYTALYINLSAS